MILYHKEPTKSSRFVNKKIWQEIKNINPNILLCHARGASPGVGLPIYNKNNHPFVSEDLSLALIHNGRVPNNIYKYLLKNYQVNSKCDSEMLFRIYQSSYKFDKTSGIQQIIQNAYESHMALAIGQLIEKEKRLCLFRNEFRSIFIIDLIEDLNQIFFVSTAEIWNDSIKNLEIKKFNIQEMPVEEVCIIETKNKKLLIEKFEVKTEGFSIYNEKNYYECNEINFCDKNIYTNLNEKEESLESDVESIISSKEICSNLISHLYEIEENIDNYDDYGYFLEKLTNAEKEILNILKIIKK